MTQTNPPIGLLPIPCFTVCIPNRRVAYMRQDNRDQLVVGKSPPHASAIVYVGQRRREFADEFARRNAGLTVEFVDGGRRAP